MDYGIIGCGSIGAAHARTVSANPAVQRVLLYDLVAERAGALAQKVGGTACASLDELIARAGAVSVTTVPQSHASLARKLLESGRPVFCEKPLALDVQQAADLVLLSRRTGVPLMVGFKMRYEPVFELAREHVGRLGRLYSVVSTKVQPLTGTPEKQSWVRQVGAMYELSVHEIDLLAYIAEVHPARIQHAAVAAPEGWTRERRFSVTSLDESGIVGFAACAYCNDVSFEYRDLTLTFVGEKGYMRVERPSRVVLNTHEYQVFEAPPVQDGFRRELEEFVARATGGSGVDSRLSSSGVEGFETTAFVETTWASARRGRAMDIPRLEAFEAASGG